MNQRDLKPPRFAAWLLREIFPRDDQFFLAGDLKEIFREIRVEQGRFAARRWYWSQVFASMPYFFFNKIFWRIVMFKNYLKIALRNMKKHKAFSFVNIAGLAIGMACCVLMFLWVYDELSYDRFHENFNDLYRIITEIDQGGQVSRFARSPYPLVPILKETYPEIIEFVRYTGGYSGWDLSHGDHSYAGERIAFGGPAFFQMFSFPFIQGDPKTALYDRSTIVLTESLAMKCFGDEYPIGKTMQMVDRDLTVTGVIKDVPLNSHIQFDYIVPMINQTEWREQDFENWEMGSSAYIQLQQGVRWKDVQNKVLDIVNRYYTKGKTIVYLQPLSRVHLYSDFFWDGENSGRGDITYVTIFSITAICVLLIACMNFMNLSTARSVIRAKEVGLRKVIGAQRADIIRQFFSESVLLSLLAFFLALGIAFLMIPTLNMFSGKQLGINILGKSPILLGIITIACFTGVVSGSYPALFLSSFLPIKVIGGGALSTTRGRYLMRTALVVVQFGITIILLITTLVIFNQLSFMQNKDLGFDKDGIVSFAGYGRYWNQFEAAKAELLKNPHVLSVAKGFPPERIGRGNTDFQWEGKTSGENIALYPVGIDFDYIETFGMEMVEGRSFSQKYATDSLHCIINEKAVEVLGLDSSIGKQLYYTGSMGWAYGWDNREGKIIGVVKDFHCGSLHHEIPPMVLKFSSRGFFVNVKMHPEHVSETLHFLEQKWKAFVPERPFRYQFLDKQINNFYQNERRIGKMFHYFTSLAIFIACLGLFGMASFMAGQRTKEIGIRKVMGATVSKIVFLLSREFTKWVLIANIVAWPAGYFLMRQWLQNFAYRIDLGFWIFLLSAGLALVIALVTVSYQAVKAARANPVEALKYE